MNKFYETLTNLRGDVLFGYRAQVVDETGASVDIYRDRNGTRFTDADGNVVNYAEASTENGMAEFYWNAATGQILQITDSSGELARKPIEGFGDNYVLNNLAGSLSHEAVAELPAAPGTPASDVSLIIDNGTTVETATPTQLVDAAIPLASKEEAEAGTNNVKRVTPLRVKQAIDALAKGDPYTFDNLAQLEAVSVEIPEGALVALRDHPGDRFQVMGRDYGLPDIITAGGDKLKEIGRKATPLVKRDWRPVSGLGEIIDPFDCHWGEPQILPDFGDVAKTFQLPGASTVDLMGFRPNFAIEASGGSGFIVFATGYGNSGQNVAQAAFTSDFVNFKPLSKSPLYGPNDPNPVWSASRYWFTGGGYNEFGQCVAWIGGNHITNTANWGERQAGIAIGDSWETLAAHDLNEPDVTIFTANIQGWAVPGSDKIYVRTFFYNPQTKKYYIEVNAGPNNGPYRAGVLVADSWADVLAKNWREPLPGEGWTNPTITIEMAQAQHPGIYDGWDLGYSPACYADGMWYRGFKAGPGTGNDAEKYIVLARAPSLMGPWEFSEPVIQRDYGLASAILVMQGSHPIILADDRNNQLGMHVFRANGFGGSVMPYGPARVGPPMSPNFRELGYGDWYKDYPCFWNGANAYNYLKLCRANDPNHAMIGHIRGRRHRDQAAGYYSGDVYVNIPQGTSAAEEGVSWHVRHTNNPGYGDCPKVVLATLDAGEDYEEDWYFLKAAPNGSGPNWMTHGSFNGFFTGDREQLRWVTNGRISNERDPIYQRARFWNPVFIGGGTAGDMTYQTNRSMISDYGEDVTLRARMNILTMPTPPAGGNLYIGTLPYRAHGNWASDVRVTYWENLTLPADFLYWLPVLEMSNPTTSTGRIHLRYFANDGTIKDAPASILAVGSIMDISLTYRRNTKA